MARASIGGHIGTRGPLSQAVLKPEIHLNVLGPAALEQGSADVYGPCYPESHAYVWDLSCCLKPC